jgi:hypothetical protein
MSLLSTAPSSMIQGQLRRKAHQSLRLDARSVARQESVKGDPVMTLSRLAVGRWNTVSPAMRKRVEGDPGKVE